MVGNLAVSEYKDAMRALSNYTHSAPSDQNALDIFAGEWTSILPDSHAHLRAGTLPLFVDPRMQWAIDQMAGVTGKSVLELGPLEGAHSYMLEKAGADKVFAIESNTGAFLRCLVLKEVLALHRVNYACGDFSEYLRTSEANFDAVIASGVLYHQLHPMRLISDIARVSSSVYIWTHYYDPVLIANNAGLIDRFGEPEIKETDAFEYTQVEYRYEQSLEWSGSCGGTHSSCSWLTRQAIIEGLTHFGFSRTTIAYDEPHHKHGPSMAIVATK